MHRKLLISLHLYLAAFFAPAIILVAISGGLYLIGEKGSVVTEKIYEGSHPELSASSSTIKADVSALLTTAGVSEYDFEYVKAGGNTFYTRPTSRDHYIIRLKDEGSLSVELAQPNFQAAIIELHKGHGPGAFKTFQKVLAAGLFLIVISGLWLGISAPSLRTKSLATTVAGGVILLVLIFS